MAFSLSPIGNEQQANSNGAPLSGGLLYTYLAGSTTPAPTYTDSTGTTPQANPVVLNTLGRPTDPVWLTDGVAYKFVLTSSTGVAQWTIDNIKGVSSSTPTQDEWVLQSTVPTYISATQFSVPGDQTATFTVGRRVRAVCTGGVRYGYISVSAFTTLTTVTLVIDSGSLDSGLSAVSVGLLSSVNSSMPWLKSSSTGLTAQGTMELAANASTALQAVPKQQLDSSVSAETAARTAAISAAVAPATLAPTLLVAGTPVALSGSGVQMGGIPSWAKRVTVLFENVALSGSDALVLELGTASSIESTGYLGGGCSVSSSAIATTYTTGFLILVGSSTYTLAGSIVLASMGSNTWAVNGAAAIFTGVSANLFTAGRKSLADALTRVQLRTSGSNTFVGGTATLLWE